MDRNLVATPAVLVTTGSLSARRAWIEMLILVPVLVPLCVALRKESVDRNSIVHLRVLEQRTVALRKESVDRNGSTTTMACKADVALRKESVDRNGFDVIQVLTGYVALRKESVDRNLIRRSASLTPTRSLSARRAWIEIRHRHTRLGMCSSRSPQGERG